MKPNSIGNALIILIILVALKFFVFSIPGLTPVIPIRSQATVDINTSSSGDTVVVSHVTGNVIRFTYHLMANGTTNVDFEYGTGTNCASGNTVIDGPYSLIAQTGMTGIDMIVPAGNDLCINNSAAVQVGGAVSYITYAQ